MDLELIAVFVILQNVLVEQILEPGKRVTVAMGTNRDITTGKSPSFVPGNKHGYADVPCKSSLLLVEFRNLRFNMDILLSTLGSDSHLVVQYYEYQEKKFHSFSVHHDSSFRPVSFQGITISLVIYPKKSHIYIGEPQLLEFSVIKYIYLS
jgi:hypothetical protein